MMNAKALTPVACLALLLGAACSGGDDPEPAPRPVSEDAATTTGAESGSGETGGQDQPTEPAEAPGQGGGEEEEEEEEEADAGGTPQPTPLDIEMRHPSEIVLRLNRLSFEGDDIVIDAEIVNSSRNDVTFHQGNWSSGRLRLVDDAGEEYNFIEPVEDEPVQLTPGETVTGSLAFRGPLRGEPASVRMVNNIHTEDIAGWTIDEETESSTYPVFVVPIELTWS